MRPTSLIPFLVILIFGRRDKSLKRVAMVSYVREVTVMRSGNSMANMICLSICIVCLFRLPALL